MVYLKANKVTAQKSETMKALAAEYDKAVAALELMRKTRPNATKAIAKAEENVANLAKYKSKEK